MRFQTWFNVYVGVLVSLLLWSVLASAQTNTNTSSAASAESTTAAAAAAVVASKEIRKSAGAEREVAAEADKTRLTFGLDRVDALQIEVIGNPAWKYIAFFIFVLGAFFIAKAIDFVIGVVLKRWALKTQTKLDDLFLELINGPIKVVAFVVLLHIGLRLFAWPAWAEDILSKALKMIVACSLTYMGLKCVDLFLGYWKKRAVEEPDRSFDDHLFPIIRKSLKVFVVTIAVLVTSQNMGLDVTGVLASLSIGGLAIGLAAQDTLANLFGAVSVFVDKPFRIGDHIKLDSVDGVVESIGLRSTRVRNMDGYLVTIPNKTMGNTTITNITRRPTIRTVINIGLTYDTSVEKVREALWILDEVYRGHPMTKDVAIGFNTFGDSALNVNVVHHWKNTDGRAHLTGMQDINLTIKQRFEQAGIEFAFPSRTLYVHNQGPKRDYEED
jgi:MscS family membrane protein